MHKPATQRAHPLSAPSLLLMLCLLLIPAAVEAQGFGLRPTLLPMTARPGATVTREVVISNVMPEGTTTVTVQPLFISQDSEGLYTEVDPQDPEPGQERAIARSCADWITLSTDMAVLEPRQESAVTVTVRIPSSARGFYYAGVVAAETTPGTGQLRIDIQFRIVALVLLTVQGPAARQQIALTGAEMNMIPATPRQPASTAAALVIANQGESYAHVRGTVTVFYQTGEQWRRLTQVDINERGVLPGVTISPSADLKRALPAGRYRLRGQIHVDNRPGRAVDLEVDYEGDPAVTTVAADVNLSITPPEVTIDAIPGSHRQVVLRVQNLSEQAVHLIGALRVPQALLPQTAGDTRGEAFDGTPWLSLTPDSFTLNVRGRAGMRIACAVPEGVVIPPHTYGELLLRWTYPDGTSAGESVVPLTINIADSPTAKELKAEAQQIDLAHQADSLYAVMAKFGNTGNVAFAPQATATVRGEAATPMASKALDTTLDRVLPLGTVQFSGELDFEALPPGTYALVVTLTADEQETATAQLPIQVQEENGHKTVLVLETPEDGEEPAADAEG